jgi:hypothetical protein
MKPSCSVVVIYEDPTIREAAVDFCDHLVERFWARCGVEVSWWSFSQLGEPMSAREATQKALVADLIVTAVRPEGAMEPYVQAWLETGLKQRGEREGALVGLTGPTMSTTTDPVEKQMYLRNLAHRSGMDYLTCVPPGLGYSEADSWHWCAERAYQITSVLNEILEQKANPRVPR